MSPWLWPIALLVAFGLVAQVAQTVHDSKWMTNRRRRSDDRQPE